MDESNRVTAQEIANRYLSKGDAFGWFEELYTQANGDASIVPWADLMPNPNLVTWLDNHGITGAGLPIWGTLLTELNKSDERNKDKGPERW
jgi:hypothetical protein